MLPAVAGAIVTLPEPLGLIATLAFAGLHVTVIDSVNVVNAKPCTKPKEVYNSWKLSLIFLKASRIGSPVPSLPFTPTSMSFLAMIYLK
jgi:hypothetical protein